MPSFPIIYSEGEHGVPEISGSLILTDDQGEQIDTYQIRVVCSHDYPMSFPLVYETGGRIPLNIDWHVYPDGHACICTQPEEYIVCNSGITLPSFIDHQIKPYLFNQKYREMHGFFLQERSHGRQGNIQFLKEIFKTNNLRLITKWLFYIQSSPEPNRVHDCFCGSRIKYRRCHRDVFRLLKPLSKQTQDRLIQFAASSAALI